VTNESGQAVKEPSPVLLFAFKRVEHLSDILNSINDYMPPVLYICVNRGVCEEDELKVEAVKKLISSFPFKCRTRMIVRTEHLSLTDNFQCTLDLVFQHEDTLIVLEDDLIPSRSFYQFCNRMLLEYGPDSDVGCIVGSNLNAFHMDRSYLLSNIGIPYWGWATWRQKWSLYRSDNTYWPILSEVAMRGVSPKNQQYFYECFNNNSNGLNLWDLQWCLSLLANRQYTILPGKNLITNRGFDADASTTRTENSKFSTLPSFEVEFEDVTAVHMQKFQGDYENRVIEFFAEAYTHLTNEKISQIAPRKYRYRV
jgi:hypothetical protein